MSAKLGKTAHLAALALLGSMAASAATIGSITDILTISDPTQVGRLSRNGVPQDWVGSEVFPGVINTTTTYVYQTYLFNTGPNTFLQATIDDVSTTDFLSLYLGSYSPDSAGTPNFGFNTNWLGDAGSSGNAFGTDPISFQAVAPAFSNVLLVVNSTLAAPGLPNSTYNLLLEGWIDSDYTDAPTTTTPEPSTMFLMSAAMGAMGLHWRKKSKQNRLESVEK